MVTPVECKRSNLLGRHFLGHISDVIEKQMGTEEKPNPMRACAAMSRPIVWDPGAMPHPTNDMSEVTTSSSFLAWNLSDAEDNSGATTAWTSERAFGTQVSVGTLLRSLPM